MKATWSKASVTFIAEQPTFFQRLRASLPPYYTVNDKCSGNFEEIQINCAHDESFNFIKMKLYRSDDKTVEQKEIIDYLKSIVQDYEHPCEMFIERTLLREHTSYQGIGDGYSAVTTLVPDKRYIWKLTCGLRPKQ
ncbi:unnamed protein product [Rotaria sp. Silwood2]|nr:unnamed protein product [Rotaria sp. Silwood2]CAF3029565.1 unnamed protein product [Rotaria sp. Silwood2]CAF3323061.1 unnamed protein product [Rotaria sp. Silwood2]CAF3380968.1 unnamed protein product [Rotaria sp. Silwood2]CAF4214322.1 unnamed protein product [Rotaria sp. Silwood2]